MRIRLVGLVLAALVACAVAAFAVIRRSDTTTNATAVSDSVERLSLSAGCNQVALTWPAGTSLRIITDALARKDGIDMVWRYSADESRYEHWNPAELGTTDAATRAQPEEVVICLASGSLLTRPKLAGVANSVTPAVEFASAGIADAGGQPAADVAAGAPNPAPQESVAPETSAAIAAAPRAPFRTLPPGSVLPSDEQCAAAVPRASWEPRGENYEANHKPSLPMTQASLPGINFKRVTGNFSGTTDEIIQWGACKWGIDADLIRAMAVQESWWRQSAIGDHGTSFGLLQVKPSAHPGSERARESTAFNVDYVLAWLRGCYDGDYNHWLPAEARGDLWGCIGTWYAGEWKVAGARFYISIIQRQLADRQWLRSNF